MDERADVVFTFTDVLNDFAVRTDVEGQGFTALYENFLETQVATVALRMRLLRGRLSGNVMMHSPFG